MKLICGEFVQALRESFPITWISPSNWSYPSQISDLKKLSGPNSKGSIPIQLNTAACWDPDVPLMHPSTECFCIRPFHWNTYSHKYHFSMHPQEFHYSLTLEQLWLGSPICSFILLWTLHKNTIRSFLLLLVGTSVCLKVSKKSFPHYLQGYSYPKRTKKAMNFYLSFESNYPGKAPDAIWSTVQDIVPSFCLVTVRVPSFPTSIPPTVSLALIYFKYL